MTSATTTESRTDEQIQRDVLTELKWDARLQPNEIGVIVKGGVVTLTGWVDSFVKKWAAEQAVERVRGVRAVANDIEVRLPGWAERTDADIAAAVARALEWDAVLPPDAVTASVSNGWVTLRGEVEWEYQRREAERQVRRLTGVRGVTNLVTVRPKSNPSPDALRRKIQEALIRAAEVDAEQIDIDVQGDTVVLKGTVRSWAEREQAERAAWSAPGVTTVKNRITVEP
ncbi:BON domain-containing protein [Dactylosporangium matsuzakiense]|uniref:Ornithine aminotransferase n=1 Tax=Dactylosporangium matsuzakiense TaxID=53360 RepID=A0A9W6NK21_9ACTN|nr:BON domain-containing protein [Dactylosporangium matsuzakiense]GLK99276.1 ornithine aminotransferase [Dactylosporangium matsuzakiense]